MTISDQLHTSATHAAGHDPACPKCRVTQATEQTPLTEVIFRKWPKSEGGTVLALFPGDPGTSSEYTCSSYAHHGQHGSADPQGCIARTKPAKPEEYASLKRELEGQPYGYRLRVVKAAHSGALGGATGGVGAI